MPPTSCQFQRRLTREFRQSHPLHDVTQDTVRREVHLPIIAAGDDLTAKFLLCRIHGRHQFGKAAGRGRIGARDIRRITAILGAGVDQEGAQGCR